MSLLTCCGRRVWRYLSAGLPQLPRECFQYRGKPKLSELVASETARLAPLPGARPMRAVLWQLVGSTFDFVCVASHAEQGRRLAVEEWVRTVRSVGSRLCEHYPRRSHVRRAWHCSCQVTFCASGSASRVRRGSTFQRHRLKSQNRSYT